MRTRTLLSQLAVVALACSGSEPTEIKPNLELPGPGGCTVNPTLTAPASMSVPTQTAATSQFFFLKNNCTGASSGPWDFIAVRTGAVATVAGVNPSWATIPGGGTAKISVSFTTGATAGTGAINFTASKDGSPVVNLTAKQIITVTSPTATPPTVTTNAASTVGAASATLNGSANPNGGSTTGWFRYSTTNPGSCNDTFGTRAPSTGGAALGSGTTAVAYNRAVTGLTSHVTYYYCAVASNSAGMRFGTVRSFLPGGGVFTIYSLWNGSTLKANVDPFNGSLGHNETPNLVIPRIEEARRRGMTLILALTGGNHTNYLVPCSNCIGNDSVFDLGRWRAVLAPFATQEIQDAIARAVADGVVLGNLMVDEPHHFSWGGYFTKLKLDDMWEEVHAIFPTLPTGVSQGGKYGWQAAETYEKLDFVIYHYAQFSNQLDIAGFRTNSLAQAAADGVVPILGVNLLDGGTRLPDCPTPQTGGIGTFGDPEGGGWTGNCRMTPDQILNAANILLAVDGSGRRAAGFSGWQYDGAMMANATYRQKFLDVRGLVNALPRRSYKRGS